MIDNKIKERVCCERRPFANKIIPPATWDIVDKLLLEKFPIDGVLRVTDISEPWLLNYINKKYERTLKKRSIDVIM